MLTAHAARTLLYWCPLHTVNECHYHSHYFHISAIIQDNTACFEPWRLQLSQLYSWRTFGSIDQSCVYCYNILFACTCSMVYACDSHEYTVKCIHLRLRYHVSDCHMRRGFETIKYTESGIQFFDNGNFWFKPHTAVKQLPSDWLTLSPFVQHRYRG